MVTYVKTPKMYWPEIPPWPHAASLTSVGTIDATGEKMAWLGQVWNKDHATKNLTRVGFRFGSVTKAGGSALTVSLQDVDTATGPPYQPDGTQDQTVAIANADASFASNTWYRTGAFSASRSVAFGAKLAVVVEYDGGGRLGADTVSFSNHSTFGGSIRNFISGIVANQSSAWAVQNAFPNIALEFDDGTFGTFQASWPASALTTVSLNTGTTPDELALLFTVPTSMKIDGAWLMPNFAANAEADIVLYEGASTLATVSIDLNVIEATGNRMLEVMFSDQQTLTPGNTYRLALKPTTANTVQIIDLTVSDANHFQAWPGGTSWYLSHRADAGAWTDVTTRRPTMGIIVSSIAEAGGTTNLLRGKLG